MTETDHKPAPWQFVEAVSPCGQDWLGCGVVAGDGNEFVWMEDDPETDIPTARLIAAAPDLLDALKEVVSEYDNPDNGRSLRWAIDEARAAIARATGEKESDQ